MIIIINDIIVILLAYIQYQYVGNVDDDTLVEEDDDANDDVTYGYISKFINCMYGVNWYLKYTGHVYVELHITLIICKYSMNNMIFSLNILDIAGDMFYNLYIYK